MTKIPQRIHDYSTAQVVAIGEGKYGIVWNGQLRPEEYCPYRKPKTADRPPRIG